MKLNNCNGGTLKVLSFIVVAILSYSFMSASVHLTKTYEMHQSKIAEELLQKEFEIAEEEKKTEIFNKKAEKISFRIKKINPSISDEIALKISKVFLKKSKEHDLKVEKLIVIAAVESRFNHRATNNSGDYGLMQVNWYWWGSRFCKKPSELFHIETNVEIACRILKANKKMGFRHAKYYHSLDHERASIYEKRLLRFASNF